MHVASSVAKNTFRAHSGIAWNKIEKEVLKNLDSVVLLVQLAYRVSGDVGKMFYLNVKISPHVGQKQLRFNDKTGTSEFIKFTKKYHQQLEEEQASVSRLEVCAVSPLLLQTLAEYCRKTM